MTSPARWLALLPALTLAACLSRGPGALAAPPIPMLSAERAAIQERTDELHARLTGSTVRGRERTESQAEVDLLTRRLAEGDLLIGDQLVITIVSDSGVQVDTATVRDGMLVAFAGLPDLNLARTLQAEIAPRLQAHSDRFFRNRTVRVVIPVRVAVLGEVARPGFYSLAADRPVSELIMLAGGPSSVADLNRVVVRRNGRTVLGAAAWERAQQAGITIGALGLRPGDEIAIGRRRQVNWAQLTQVALVAVGASVAILQILLVLYGTEE
jgi:protein involved in polysaccharide export with SLBB domain